ncbi:MAG: hypothetical protein ACXABY_27425 [Candidatus Thorarchaeota archaeon]|jgi:hypothetical protein
MSGSNPVRIVGPVDKAGGGLIVSDARHAKAHEGEVFVSSYKSPDASLIADNASLDVLIIPDASHEVVMAYRLSSTGAYELAFYEDTTISSNGTELPARNRSRPKAVAIAATAKAYHTPTVTVVGQLLLNEVVSGVLGGPNVSPITADNEWILKASVPYLIRIINRSGSAQSMSIVISWYEE